MSIRKVKELKIGALRYSIERRPKPVSDTDEHSIGSICYSSAQILLFNAMSEQSEILTLLHEVVHGLCYHSGVEWHDERFIETCAGLLFDFIRDNPKLISAIQDTARRKRGS